MTCSLNRPSRLALTLVIAALMTASAVAQKKKPPPGMEDPGNAAPADPAADPAEAGTKAPPPDPTQHEPSAALKKQFEAAVEKDNFPKVLFMVGQDARPSGAVPVGTRDNQTTGITAGNNGVGSTMLDFDRTGITDVLESALGGYLQDGFGEFVDPSSLADAEKAEIKGKASRDEDDGIATMAQKLNADIVLYIRFQAIPRDATGDHNERWRCVAEIKHLRRRSTIKVTPFDWDGPVDVRNARRYAGALAEEYMTQYCKMVERSSARHEVSVRVENLPLTMTTADVVALFTGLDGIKGRPKVNDMNQNPSNLNDADLSIQYAGETYDLEDAVRKAAAKNGLVLTTSRQESNRLIMTASSGIASATSADTCWFYVTEKDSDQQKKFIEMVKKNPGKLAVVVNWVLDPDQRIADTTTTEIQSNPWQYTITSTHDPVSQLKGNPRLGNVAAGTQTVTLEQLQNTIAELFSDSGLFVVDANAVSTALEKQRTKLNELSVARKPETDVMTVLKNSEGYDYIIWAKAQLRTVGQLNDENKAKYSFTLYDVKSGRLLGSVSWDGSDQQFTRAEIKGVPKKNLRESRVSDVVARYIGGTLMCKWMNKPPYVEFEVYGAKELGEVKRFEDAIESRVDSATPFGLAYDNGVGKFVCGFEGSAEALKTQVEKIASEYDGRKGKVTEVQANKIIFTFDK